MSRYVPKEDVEGINSTTENPLSEFALLLLGGLGLVVVMTVTLVVAGEWLFTKLSPEREISWLSSRFLETRYPLTSHESIERILRKLEEPGAPPLRLSIICDKQINAFAVPGGIVAMTSGLVEKIKSERALAFVIAHEIGHFHHRDHLRGLGRRIGLLLAMSVVGFDGSGLGLDFVQDAIARSYDRQQEADADAHALKTMKRVYGEVDGAGGFFELLLKEEAVMAQLPAFFSTHPHPKERLQEIRRQESGTVPEDLDELDLQKIPCGNEKQ
jgi:beta-barrel assembly-enhancing protease